MAPTARTAALLCLGLLTTALAFHPASIVANCGDWLCHCHGNNASCYGNDTATYLPMLPPHITWLDFDRFRITSVTPQVLRNVTTHNVQHLGLTFFKLRYIDPQIFLHLPNMTDFDLSGNLIPESQLKMLLQGIANHTKMTSLILGSMNLATTDFLAGGGLKHLKFLNLQRNNINNPKFIVLSSFPQLQGVKMDRNHMTAVSLSQHGNLERLNLAYNELKSLPAFCPVTGTLFPNLRHLRLNTNRFRYVTRNDISCLTSLELIDVSKNDIIEIYTNTFSDLPLLQTVYVAHMTVMARFHAYAFNNSNLQEIVFNDNKIYETSSIDPNVFAGCPNVSKLNLGNNNLVNLGTDFLLALFAPLKSLKKLNLVQCQLKTMPSFISKLKCLTELNMAENIFNQLNSTILEQLQHLQALDLSSNGLTFAEENAIPVTLQETLQTVDLHGNSFSCTCDILWLTDWIHSNTTRFIGFPDKYTCGSPSQGVRLADVVLTDQSCLLSSTSRLLVVGCSAILLLALVVFSLVYRYRWHLQYLVFMARYDRARRPADRADYRFDAFVAYSADDHEWVVTQLMPALEDAHGLRLCLHERDFLAGNLVVDNIVDNISKSRRVLVVMSNGFALSEWCQFELNLAQRLTLERGEDLMVVAMLEEVARARVTRVMYAVLKTITYITWPPEERDREAFWTNLTQALK